MAEISAVRNSYCEATLHCLASVRYAQMKENGRKRRTRQFTKGFEQFCVNRNAIETSRKHFFHGPYHV